jgi:hypothetical protein
MDADVFRLFTPLTSIQTNSQLILSWPTNAVESLLQATTSLTPPVTWTQVTNGISIVDGRYVATNSLSVDHRFYRLKQ